MKHARLVCLTALLVVFACGMAAPAHALEVNINGDFHFAFVTEGNPGFKDDEHDTFWARSRFRSTIEFVASENLKGFLHLTTRLIYWGVEGDNGGPAASPGGQLDTNKSTLAVHQAFIDWKVPNTGLSVKMGLQYLFLPMAVSLSPVMNTPVAGVHTSYRFNDNVTGNLAWYRPWENGSSSIKDSWDMFYVAVPLTFDSFDLTPWGQYSFLGKNLSRQGDSPFRGMGWTKKARVWHAGLAANVRATENISVKADFIYGGLETSGAGTETDGFFADLKVSYDLGMGQLGVALWYASGDSKNSHRKQDYGQMPSFTNSPEHEIGWGLGVSSFGFWGDRPICHAGTVSGSGVGTTGVSLMVENLTFVGKLTHDIRLLYYTGTNNKHNIGANARDVSQYRSITGGYAYLLEKDHLWEINFDHNYEVMPGFNINLNCGYVYADWYKEKQRDYTADNMWRVTLGFQYAF